MAIHVYVWPVAAGLQASPCWRATSTERECRPVAKQQRASLAASGAGQGANVRRGCVVSRDLDLEQRWLIEAAEGDTSGWAAHATERLEQGEREYGSWVGRTVGGLIEEAAEEAADLGGWGALVLQALEGLELDVRDRQLAEALLTVAATHAAKAHANLAAVSVLTRRAER